LVNRIIDELEELYPNSGDVSVIATGGLAPLVLGISESIEFHEPDLTLIGLRLVHERN
jgi:type III pantothenate kinase